jgi:hypothetical protein
VQIIISNESYESLFDVIFKFLFCRAIFENVVIMAADET